jgi:hypothetical protein
MVPLLIQARIIHQPIQKETMAKPDLKAGMGPNLPPTTMTLAAVIHQDLTQGGANVIAKTETTKTPTNITSHTDLHHTRIKTKRGTKTEIVIATETENTTGTETETGEIETAIGTEIGIETGKTAIRISDVIILTTGTDLRIIAGCPSCELVKPCELNIECGGL